MSLMQHVDNYNKSLTNPQSKITMRASLLEVMGNQVFDLLTPISKDTPRTPVSIKEVTSPVPLSSSSTSSSSSSPSVDVVSFEVVGAASLEVVVAKDVPLPLVSKRSMSHGRSTVILQFTLRKPSSSQDGRIDEFTVRFVALPSVCEPSEDSTLSTTPATSTASPSSDTSRDLLIAANESARSFFSLVTAVQRRSRLDALSHHSLASHDQESTTNEAKEGSGAVSPTSTTPAGTVTVPYRLSILGKLFKRSLGEDDSSQLAIIGSVRK